MKRLVGVDVGASHIEAAFAQDVTSAIARVQRPGIVVKPGRVVQAAEEISRTVDAVVQKSGSETHPDCIAVGAAGTHTEELRLGLEAVLQPILPETKIHVTTDGAIALEAAFGSGPGIVVCAGTGSIAYARTPRGEVCRVGGLGPILADEGSGYAIGKAGLRSAARAADGRSPTTSLVDSIQTELGLENLDQLIDWAWETDRPAVAELARSVFGDAASGDHVAKSIVESAANDLGQLVIALAHHFDESVALEVAVSGGILRPESPIRSALVASLKHELPDATVMDGSVDPVMGAISVASRMATD